MSFTDEEIGSFWQRFVLTLTHVPDVIPMLVFARLQRRFVYDNKVYWPEIIMCLMIGFNSTFHHLCGNYPAQHLEGYEFCISTAEVLLFTDQMWASTVINVFAMYGPDITAVSFVKVGYAISLGMNGSIAYYNTSDSIRYTWFAFVFVIFCLSLRCVYLKGKNRLSTFFQYHVNLVDIAAGIAIASVAYMMKGYGDSGDHYTIGHGIWQTLSLGPSMGLWANASSMEYSLFCWKRRKPDGKFYADNPRESMFYLFPNGNIPKEMSELATSMKNTESEISKKIESGQFRPEMVLVDTTIPIEIQASQNGVFLPGDEERQKLLNNGNSGREMIVRGNSDSYIEPNATWGGETEGF